MVGESEGTGIGRTVRSRVITTVSSIGLAPAIVIKRNTAMSVPIVKTNLTCLLG